MDAEAAAEEVATTVVDPTEMPFTVIFPLVGFSCDGIESLNALRVVLVMDAVRVPFPAPFSMVHSPDRVDVTRPTMERTAAAAPLGGSEFKVVP